MAQSSVVSFVGRMPFDGIRVVRPAAQYHIREQLQNIVARGHIQAEAVQAFIPAAALSQDSTEIASGLIDAAVTYGSVAVLGHSVIGLLQQVNQ